MIANRKDSDEERAVDPELQRLLFQVLGALNHASHMITQVLARGRGPVNAAPVSAEFSETSASTSEASQPAPLVTGFRSTNRLTIMNQHLAGVPRAAASTLRGRTCGPCGRP